MDTFRISQPRRTLTSNNNERDRNHSAENSKINSIPALNYNSSQLYRKLKSIADNDRENQKNAFNFRAKRVSTENQNSENTPLNVLQEYGLSRKPLSHQKNYRSEHLLLKPITKAESKEGAIQSPAVAVLKKETKKEQKPKNLIQIEDQKQKWPPKKSLMRPEPIKGENDFLATFSVPNLRESRARLSNANLEPSEDDQNIPSQCHTERNAYSPAKQTQTEPLSRIKKFPGAQIDAADSIQSPCLLDPLQLRHTRIVPQKILLPLRGSHARNNHYISPERGFSTATLKPKILSNESPLQIEFSNKIPNFYLNPLVLDQEPKPRYSYQGADSYNNSLRGGYSMTPGLMSESQNNSFSNESYFKSCFKNQKVVLKKIFKDGINF